MNRIKDEKRAALSNETLNDLLKVSARATSLKDFSPDSAINLRCEAKQRPPIKVQESSTIHVASAVTDHRSPVQRLLLVTKMRPKLFYLMTGING